MKPDYTIYFDGACEPVNPGGIATAGWCIRDVGGAEIAFGRRVVASGPRATNNLAEWSALGFALRRLLDHHSGECHGKNLLIRGDSMLVCRQLTRAWRCNAPHLRRLRERCLEILGELRLDGWRTEWIPRERNTRADELSKLAYVELTGQQPPDRGKRMAG